jgi:cyclophilin family peptidyl-prolyl cis-trans isomerase
MAATTLSSGCGSNNTVVVMETSAGPVRIELFDDEAPITVKNFLQYVDDKHYDGTIFHRVIKGFMIQGGGWTPEFKEKPSRTAIKNESFNGLTNVRGTVAMARTPVPDSATSEFFVNVVDNDFLNRAKAQDGVGYCVFGKVIEGMDVVDKIRNGATLPGDRPVNPAVIKSIRRVNPK